MVSSDSEGRSGIVFNIQRFSLHDGPGIRTIVFLKGCPLRCRWCDNPEAINPYPELGFIKAHCTRCGKCVLACQEQAIRLNSENIPRVDRQRCTNCGECTAVCFPQALVIYGRAMTADEVFEEVKQDEIFYRDSGGVTASGGEPLLQAPFVRALFERCRAAKIHTALETCGFAKTKALKEVLPVTDYVLFDLKHMDSQTHQKLTGRPNTLILKNATIVAESGVPVLFRTPLIPGINGSLENIKETAHFLRALQAKPALELMPYHRLGKGKYDALHRPYRLEKLQPYEPEQVESVRQAYEDLGIQCTVSK